MPRKYYPPWKIWQGSTNPCTRSSRRSHWGHQVADEGASERSRKCGRLNYVGATEEVPGLLHTDKSKGIPSAIRAQVLGWSCWPINSLESFLGGQTVPFLYWWLQLQFILSFCPGPSDMVFCTGLLHRGTQCHWFQPQGMVTWCSLLLNFCIILLFLSTWEYMGKPSWYR